MKQHLHLKFFSVTMRVCRVSNQDEFWRKFDLVAQLDLLMISAKFYKFFDTPKSSIWGVPDRNFWRVDKIRPCLLIHEKFWVGAPLIDDLGLLEILGNFNISTFLIWNTGQLDRLFPKCRDFSHFFHFHLPWKLLSFSIFLKKNFTTWTVWE